jgi:hypothetical protein
MEIEVSQSDHGEEQKVRHSGQSCDEVLNGEEYPSEEMSEEGEEESDKESNSNDGQINEYGP